MEAKLEKHKPIATHIYLDCFDVDAKLLNNGIKLLRILYEACKKARVKIEDILLKFYYPVGITIQVNISESHVSLYTYPEENFCMVDILICGEKDATIVSSFILKELKTHKYTIKKEIVGKIE
jgi:S-adenosylmethionine decarboxylase